jgi:glucosamine kinase
MEHVLHSAVLAIDGGGTRCRVAVFAGSVITSVETGSANVSTDFDGAVREITAGLEKLAARLGWSMEQLSGLAAFVGLAGVMGPAIAGQVRAALPFKHVRVEDDRPAAVRGVLGQRDGVVAHCGTGSFCASQIGGVMRLAGGWGPVLGDEASAQWIGRTALRLTLECVDGRRKSTRLAAYFLARFDGSAGIVRFAGTAQPSEFGALAREVTAYAERGDSLAKEILRLGACEIAQALPLVGWHPGLPICLTGGIGPKFSAYLPRDMQANLSAAEGEPLVGALSLARDFAQEIEHARQ